jgi:L-malate glycosyltransferase
MKYRLYLIKRCIEDIIIFPFILVGRMVALIKPLPREYDVFFFFPFYHTGGAEKVHAMVAQATGNSNCIIFFTRKSKDKNFLDEFVKTGCAIQEISQFTDNKWIYFMNLIYRGIITGYINKQQKKPLVFNGQCNFGYKITPWVNKNIPQVELIHSLCSFSYIRIPFLPFITKTVMISTIRINEHLQLYKRYGIPAHYAERIQFIMNGIPLPQQQEASRPIVTGDLTVLYVGRSTAEKRVQLIAEVARQVKATAPQITFTFLGDVADAIPAHLHQYCTFLGSHGDSTYIHEVYTQSHILILASDTEGFPMVIMEAMARGLAILTTAVGEIPLHVKDHVNGFLMHNFDDGNAVVSDAVSFILQLNDNRNLLHEMSLNNIHHAYESFGIERFNKQYKDLFSEALMGKTNG